MCKHRCTCMQYVDVYCINMCLKIQVFISFRSVIWDASELSFLQWGNQCGSWYHHPSQSRAPSKKTTTSNFQRPQKNGQTSPPNGKFVSGRLALRQIRGIHRIQLSLFGMASGSGQGGVRSTANRSCCGPSLEGFNGSRVHLLTVIFLHGYPLPVPKITWFKVGKKNNPLPKTKQRDWGVFWKASHPSKFPTCLYKNHKRHISCCTWTCMAPFPIHILPNLRWKHRKKNNPLRGLVKVT